MPVMCVEFAKHAMKEELRWSMLFNTILQIK